MKSRRKKEAIDETQKYSTWVGEDDTDGSAFHFVQDKYGRLAASFVDMMNHNVVQIRTKGGETIATITPSRDFPKEGEPPNRKYFRKLEESPEKTSFAQSPPFNFELSNSDTISRNRHDTSRKLYDDLGGNIDLMVLWTAKAACAAYGDVEGCTITSDHTANMESLVALAVDETNIAFRASGVNTQLLLVRSYQHPSYVETSYLQTLEDASSGDMADVHANRIVHGADVVHLIVDLSDMCGLGYLGPSIDLMYSVSYWSCATGFYSFGHAIAHNFGMLRDRGTEKACGVEGYNYGYRDPEARLRTIMAYDCVTGECDNNVGGGCNRVARFSTPDGKFINIAIGAEGTENAVLTINNELSIVAAYYEHGISITNAPSVTPSVSLMPSAAPCLSNEIDVEVHFTSDRYPDENSWYIESQGINYARDGNFTKQNHKSVKEECLDAGNCYTFTFEDTFGDGLLYDADITLYVDGIKTLVDTNTGFYSLTAQFGFCSHAPTTSPPTTIPSSIPTIVPTITKSPSLTPTFSFSPSAPPSYSSTDWCVDTNLRFRFKWWHRRMRRNCDWVGRRMTRKRCKIPGVASMCPQTCKKCVPCDDGVLRFRFRYNKRMISRDCSKCFVLLIFWKSLLILF